MNSNREIWHRLVAIEGIDGAGTTTLKEGLHKALARREIPHQIGQEPTDSPIGQFIRQALSGDVSLQDQSMALLFAADRREHLYGEKGIETFLKQGGISITDRYFFSSLAYQSLNIPWAWVDQLNSEYPLPGFLIYLELPVEDAMNRLSRRKSHEIYEKQEVQDRVVKAYRHSINAYKESGMNILKIDSRESPEELLDQALYFIKDIVKP